MLVETTRWTHPEETGGKVFSLINIIIYAAIPCLSLFPSNMSPISSIVQVHFIIRIFFAKHQEDQLETERFPSYRSLFDLLKETVSFNDALLLVNSSV